MATTNGVCLTANWNAAPLNAVTLFGASRKPVAASRRVARDAAPTEARASGHSTGTRIQSVVLRETAMAIALTALVFAAILL